MHGLFNTVRIPLDLMNIYQFGFWYSDRYGDWRPLFPFSQNFYQYSPTTVSSLGTSSAQAERRRGPGFEGRFEKAYCEQLRIAYHIMHMIDMTAFSCQTVHSHLPRKTLYQVAGYILWSESQCL